MSVVEQVIESYYLKAIMAPLLEVKNLSTHFFTDDGLIKAVDRISYDIHEGETIGLVGESGCGKSVSALSLLRLIPNPPGKIVEGEILFQGHDLLKLTEDEMCDVRGNKMAMIFQEPMNSLNPVRTIGWQISEPMEIHLGMSREEGLKKCVQLLTDVKIPEPAARVNAYPHLFSGGMRQRTMIAMGLGCNPKLIIADEPTTALDVTTQAQLLELMKNLTRTYNTALIIITHNLGVVARYADRINVMYAGRIIEKGTAIEIFKEPSTSLYRRIDGLCPPAGSGYKEKTDTHRRSTPGFFAYTIGMFLSSPLCLCL